RLGLLDNKFNDVLRHPRSQRSAGSTYNASHSALAPRVTAPKIGGNVAATHAGSVSSNLPGIVRIRKLRISTTRILILDKEAAEKSTRRADTVEKVEAKLRLLRNDLSVLQNVNGCAVHSSDFSCSPCGLGHCPFH